MTSPLRILLFLALLALRPPTASGEEDSVAFAGPLAKNLAQAGRKLVALAEEIPADRYSWRPSPEVRSVSEILMHVAVGNFQLPASVGAADPQGIEIPETVWDMGRQRRQWERELVDKTVVVARLRRSFTYAYETIPGLGDLDAEVATWGFRATKRDYLLILQSHAHEHLGQLIAYARALGITPPWSRRSDPVAAESTAEIEGTVARVEIESIDRWGNLLTTLVASDLDTIGVGLGDNLRLEGCGGSGTALFGEEIFDVRPDEWIAFLAPDGRLTIAMSYGSAAEALGCGGPGALSIQPAAE